MHLMFRKDSDFPQLEGLAATLLSLNSRVYDREVAALELGAYDEPLAEYALVHIASRTDEPRDVLSACGASIGDIWRRKGRFDRHICLQIRPEALLSLLEELEEDFPDEVSKMKV